MAGIISRKKRLRNSIARYGAFPAAVIGAACFAGCAAVPKIQPLASVESSDASYTVNILEEVNDGKRLYVTADVLVKDAVDAGNAVLRLRAMSNGEPVGEAFSPLTSENRSSQNPEHHTVKISVDAVSFTDYQLDLLWGHDADQYVDSLPQSQTVAVSDIALIPGPKGKNPSITGRFENRGFARLTSLTALVQLAWVPKGASLDLSALKPENDVEVAVPDLNIPPGQSREFSIELETEIPKASGGSYIPIVRIKDEPRNISGESRSDSVPEPAQDR